MLDSYTKDMLFINIINEYSDSEQLDIIEYLVESLKELNNNDLDKDSIEKLYYEELDIILKEIRTLKVKEHDFWLEN